MHDPTLKAFYNSSRSVAKFPCLSSLLDDKLFKGSVPIDKNVLSATREEILETPV